MSAPLAPEALAAPARYTAHGRETLDRIRDHGGDLGDALAAALGLPSLAETFGELLFTYFCEAQAIKYEDRAGLKGPREDDDAKAAFYRAMSAHVGQGAPDPRSARPGFVAYERQPGPNRRASAPSGGQESAPRHIQPRRPEAYPRLVDLLVSCYSEPELAGLARYLRVAEHMPLRCTVREFAEALTDLLDLPVLQATLCDDRPRRVDEINAVFEALPCRP